MYVKKRGCLIISFFLSVKNAVQGSLGHPILLSRGSSTTYNFYVTLHVAPVASRLKDLIRYSSPSRELYNFQWTCEKIFPKIRINSWYKNFREKGNPFSYLSKITLEINIIRERIQLNPLFLVLIELRSIIWFCLINW